ncbi:MAG: YeeE/YedE family protein [Luminiphilus sp.]|nr:YeeE/YedE family protein [Luminiphilus sp.]
MRPFVALSMGFLFGVGLALSGMTDTHKVIGFLDVAGSWDSDLLWVMGSALAVSFGLTPLILKRSAPVFAATFSLPARSDIDTRLVFGAVLFGCGWGLFGYCPGPAIVALPVGDTSTLVFVAGMILGMGLTQLTPPPTAEQAGNQPV